MPPPSPLALPDLGQELPRVLRFRRQAYGLPELAEAMLAEGVLQESDWCGSVRDSIRAGLERWTSGLLRGEPLRRIYLGLVWSNSLAPGMDPKLWLQARGEDVEEHVDLLGLLPMGGHLHAVRNTCRKLGEPIGMLAINGPHWEEAYTGAQDVFVSRAVQELETLRPGLGFQVLGLLQDTLAPVVNIGSPGWAFGQIRKTDGLRQSWEQQARLHDTYVPFEVGMRALGVSVPRHGVLMPELLRHVPEAACFVKGTPKTHLITAALKGPVPDYLRRILEQARAVDQCRHLSPDVLRCETPLFLDTRVSSMGCEGGCLKEVPFSVRWQPEDPIARIAADYHRQVREVDAGTSILWMRAWRMSDPAGTRQAVRCWKRVVGVALRGCRLAELLHSDEDPNR